MTIAPGFSIARTEIRGTPLLRWIVPAWSVFHARSVRTPVMESVDCSGCRTA